MQANATSRYDTRADFSYLPPDFDVGLWTLDFGLWSLGSGPSTHRFPP